ncbi:MAG TPA: sugar phosphate isomerase/epimerase family protein [Thermoguttaceae bacterium]|nr:sugar phosphate isomerase/epimerase family protein [Thermoguttaceae bacterium]HPP53983.1 sugar phosphate isomerase/epimerase family protein [Thermoguttaceae bacterium]
MPRSVTPTKRYEMKKAINFWALPYPDKMTLRQALELCKDAGFDGVELNFDEKGEISPEASERDLHAIGQMARAIGLQISGLCSFLFWPYSLTHEDPKKRQRGLELASQMVRACKALGTENLLVVAGSVYAPWVPDAPPVPFDVCERRAKEAIRQLLPEAEKAGVYLNIENIFVNGFLHSPQEMIQFVDSFQSDRVRVHFDTGNIMQYHFPEHWIRLLGRRIKNVHLKEASKKVHEFNLNTFRPLLDGSTNWPAVLEALDQVGYRGHLIFEYFQPWQYWPEALIYQTSDSLDWMLGRKG